MGMSCGASPHWPGVIRNASGRRPPSPAGFRRSPFGDRSTAHRADRPWAAAAPGVTTRDVSDCRPPSGVALQLPVPVCAGC